MKISSSLFAIYILISLLLSCKTSAYITDQESIERQKEMRKYRTGVNFADVGLIVASSVGAAITGIAIYPNTQTHAFKKMKLDNEAADTLFVNMVTDWRWKDSVYCDIREIVIPPLRSAKVIVPMGVAYNVFFRTDFNARDDEKVEINTAEMIKVRLKPAKEKSDTIPNF